MLSKIQLDAIDDIIDANLIRTELDHIIFMDQGGNIITKHGNGENNIDLIAFAALAAGNFASVDAMAELVGESEFSLLFHQGENLSIYFSRANDKTILVTIFNKKISLGLVRLKVAKTIKIINKILDNEYGSNEIELS